MGCLRLSIREDEIARCERILWWGSVTAPELSPDPGYSCFSTDLCGQAQEPTVGQGIIIIIIIIIIIMERQLASTTERNSDEVSRFTGRAHEHEV
jgi:hypothetical protein